MHMLVGLGNPGSEYAKNRHNIGFMAVDEIVHRHSFAPWRAKFHGDISEGRLAGEKVLVMKPSTFMNDSGRAVQAAMTFYKILPEDVVILHDELDLAGGKLRVKRGGGHAGHNGLRSVHAHIGEAYGRVRIGIGHPGDKSRVVSHVLKDFSKEEGLWVQKLIHSIADNAGLLVEANDGLFQTRVAADMTPPKEDKNDENNQKDNA
jgi:peptidyl-tRNA hydrolase, PTH1 family